MSCSSFFFFFTIHRITFGGRAWAASWSLRWSWAPHRLFWYNHSSVAMLRCHVSKIFRRCRCVAACCPSTHDVWGSSHLRVAYVPPRDQAVFAWFQRVLWNWLDVTGWILFFFLKKSGTGAEYLVVLFDIFVWPFTHTHTHTHGITSEPKKNTISNICSFDTKRFGVSKKIFFKTHCFGSNDIFFFFSFSKKKFEQRRKFFFKKNFWWPPWPPF